MSVGLFEVNFFWNFFDFGTLSEKFLGFRWKILSVVSEIAFYKSKGTFWRNLLSCGKFKIFVVIGHWAEFFRHAVRRKIPQGCENCISRVHSKKLLLNFFWKPFKVFSQLRRMGKKFLGLCRKVFVRVVETTFNASLGTDLQENLS